MSSRPSLLRLSVVRAVDKGPNRGVEWNRGAAVGFGDDCVARLGRIKRHGVGVCGLSVSKHIAFSAVRAQD